MPENLCIRVAVGRLEQDRLSDAIQVDWNNDSGILGGIDPLEGIERLLFQASWCQFRQPAIFRVMKPVIMFLKRREDLHYPSQTLIRQSTTAIHSCTGLLIDQDLTMDGTNRRAPLPDQDQLGICRT